MMLNFIFGMATAFVFMLAMSCLAINPQEPEEEERRKQMYRTAKARGDKNHKVWHKKPSDNPDD